MIILSEVKIETSYLYLYLTKIAKIIGKLIRTNRKYYFLISNFINNQRPLARYCVRVCLSDFMLHGCLLNDFQETAGIFASYELTFLVNLIFLLKYEERLVIYLYTSAKILLLRISSVYPYNEKKFLYALPQ